MELGEGKHCGSGECGWREEMEGSEWRGGKGRGEGGLPSCLRVMGDRVEGERKLRYFDCGGEEVGVECCLGFVVLIGELACRCDWLPEHYETYQSLVCETFASKVDCVATGFGPLEEDRDM